MFYSLICRTPKFTMLSGMTFLHAALVTIVDKVKCSILNHDTFDTYLHIIICFLKICFCSDPTDNSHFAGLSRV